ncbi:hypothetical protein LCGC14_2761090, partial [marine sediment metagenome]
MSPDTALWVAGILIPVAIGWAITVTMILLRLGRDSKEAVKKLRNPVEYNLGPSRD